MAKTKIIDLTGLPGDTTRSTVQLVNEFADVAEPLEREAVYLLTDNRTGAKYIECHIQASKFVELGTVDVPIDPEEQPEYRANRELVEDHAAFEKMKDDAIAKRTFSNLVAEFSKSFVPERPIKIIGGQHRFTAIQEALNKGINEYHGAKLYFELDPDQRLDVQLISNTNIAVSTDLFDRMHETLSGPGLRDWCQKVGLLESRQDFADKRERTSPITVRAARTFILNYFRGRKVDPKKFDQSETIPITCKSGVPDTEWEASKKSNAKLWTDSGLQSAAKAFADLIAAQRKAFSIKNPGTKGRPNIDFSEKALNYAVLSAWAFTAGVLHSNNVRLQRHYSLKNQVGRDPLNAAALAKGRHKSDPENYRGLGYRTDPKERGRFVELFYLQAENGEGITPALIDVAIKKYHAKEAQLEVIRAQQKAPAHG